MRKRSPLGGYREGSVLLGLTVYPAVIEGHRQRERECKKVISVLSIA